MSDAENYETLRADGAEGNQFTLSERPWKGKRPRGRGQTHSFPPLQSFDFEFAVFRESLRKRNLHIFYNRHITLFKQRSVGVERVVRVAMQNGYSAETIEAFILKEVRTRDTAEYSLSVEDAKFLIGEEVRKFRRRTASPI